MKKSLLLLCLAGSLIGFASACDQSTSADASTQALSVEERMAKARAAKADRKRTDSAGRLAPNSVGRVERATPADYQAPVDKVLKGPNGEVVHTGERGAKFYINKNGNKTYLSSNE